ncbi:MAG: DUF362 domain-containing protein [Candidatus Bathyarchaeia archaeon]
MSESVLSTGKEEAIQCLPELIQLAGYDFTTVRKVLIKPNVCGMYHPESRLVRQIVETIHPYAEAITIGETDSTIHSPEDQFRRLGMDRLADYPNVEVRGLLRDPTVKMRVPSPHAVEEIPLPSTVLDADMLLNVPGLGTHPTTTLTCALKNLFGLIAVKNKYRVLHPMGVSGVIADLYKVLKPNLNIVDAGHRVLVGIDALRVDVVAARLLDLDPYKIKHLILAARDRGLRLEDVRVEVVTP